MVNLQAVGAGAFVFGLLIAILSSTAIRILVPDISGYLPLVLVVLGLIVGFLNIADKETQAFLIAGIALVVAGIPNGALLTTLDVVIPKLGTALTAMLGDISTFAAPAVLVVSLKAFYNLSKTPAIKK
jgi:hypothetical protein